MPQTESTGASWIDYKYYTIMSTFYHNYTSAHKKGTTRKHAVTTLCTSQQNAGSISVFNRGCLKYLQG